MTSSAIGVFGFLPTTHKSKRKTNAFMMFARRASFYARLSSSTPYAVHAGNTRTWRSTIILITGKPKDPQIEPHAWIKIAQVLSLVYICGLGASTSKYVVLQDTWIF